MTRAMKQALAGVLVGLALVGGGLLLRSEGAVGLLFFVLGGVTVVAALLAAAIALFNTVTVEPNR